MGSFAQGSAAWAPHVDAGNGPLEVSGLGLGETSPHGQSPWPSSPVGSGNSPPTRRGSRHSDAVAVEEAEADNDLGVYAFRRDATPPQIIITRSSQPQRGQRSDARRGSGREQRTTERGKNMPFSTGLDPDFLS